MLTFSQGRAGPPSSGKAMADHLGTGTMAPAGKGRDDAPRTIPTLPLCPDRKLCALLAIRTDRPLEPAEIECLLSGNTATGRPIPGLTRRGSSRSLGNALGLAPGEVPDEAAMAMILSGRRVDGTPLPDRKPGGILRRLYKAYGIRKARAPKPEQLENLAHARLADGSPARGKKFMRRLHHQNAIVAYRDFTLAPDKSVSVAWALASEAERAIIVSSHHAAVEQTMADICDLVGRVRRGDGGSRGSTLGACLYLHFTHFTARPTRMDRDTARAGDMHIHSQVILLNVVLPADGKIGRLDLGQLRDRVVEFGAVYQARLATELKRHGVDVALDVRRGCARITAVSDDLIETFSARTRLGEASLESYLATNGVKAAKLSHRRQVALRKQAVQGDPSQARRDDVANELEWRRAANVQTRIRFVDPDISIRPFADGGRLDVAARAAARFMEEAGLAGRKVGVREAAARGLIAAGFESMGDIDRVASRLGARTMTLLPPAGKELIASKRADGSAIMVEGGPIDVLSEAVKKRAALETAGTRARVIVWSDAEMAAATRMARQQRRDAGLMGPDAFSIVVDGAEGVTNIKVAVGDIIAFGKPINGRGVRGRVAAAGTPVTITAIYDDGLTVRNAAGREAQISRAALTTKGSAAVAISHGYAVRGPIESGEAAVIAATAGSRQIATDVTLRPCDVLVVGSAIEIAQVRRGPRNLDELWTEIGEHFEPRTNRQQSDIVHRARRSVEDMVHRGMLRIERAAEEQRVWLPLLPGEQTIELFSQMASTVAAIACGLQAKSPKMEATDNLLDDETDRPLSNTVVGLAARPPRLSAPVGGYAAGLVPARLTRAKVVKPARATDGSKTPDEMDLRARNEAPITSMKSLSPGDTADLGQVRTETRNSLSAIAARIGKAGAWLLQVSDAQINAVAAFLLRQGRSSDVSSLGLQVATAVAKARSQWRQSRAQAAPDRNRSARTTKKGGSEKQVGTALTGNERIPLAPAPERANTSAGSPPINPSSKKAKGEKDQRTPLRSVASASSAGARQGTFARRPASAQEASKQSSRPARRTKSKKDFGRE